VTLLPGTRVAGYEIVSRLGAGAVGEVYRARDTKLGRDVAIKFLSADIASESARRRFQQEARTASSLNHPHILVVHDADEIDGRQYLVTEFVDGETLRMWLQASRRTWQEIVELLADVGDGLAAAHAAGIVHRDVKPDNILVGNNGYAKLADFGLAKLFDEESHTGTVTVEATRIGVIVGTVAYMAPEMADGQPSDARSDIFSFGVMAYEALVGRRPFDGPTDLALLQAIARRPATPLSTVRPELPMALCLAVDKALEKKPGDRYQTMREFVVDLRRALRPASDGIVATAPRRVPAFAVAAVIAIAGAGAYYAIARRAAARPPHVQLHPLTAFTDSVTQPVLSPDGRMLAFVRSATAELTGRGQIYVKLLPDGEPVQLTRDDAGKGMPAFSIDGSRIAYTVVTPSGSWDSWIVPVLGGEARPWLANASGLQWTAPQRMLFSEIKPPGIHMALVAATESRTESRDVYVPPSIRGMAHRSALSPDGTSVLVAEMDNGGMIPCRVVPFDGRSAGRVVGPATGKCTHVAWSPDGRWIYFSSNADGTFQIWRQQFPDGTPEQLTFGPTEAQGLTVAPDGSLVTSIGLNQGAVWISDNGAERQVSSEGSALLPMWGDGFPTSIFSPDGRKLYYLVEAGVGRGFGSGELWAHDLPSGTNERLLPGFPINSYDISADGAQVVFATQDPEGKSTIWRARLDRRTAPEKLTPLEARGPVFGRENDVYYRGLDGQQWFIYRLQLESGTVAKFSPDPAVNSPIISPNGDWLLSLVPANGRNSTTLLKALPTRGGEAVTICPNCYVKWTRDQRHLFLSFQNSNEDVEGATFVIPLPPGSGLPVWPAGGISSEEEARKLANVRILKRSIVFPGPSPSLFAFQRRRVHRNLYRVTIDSK
jgi:eukaryotic-like serine/threonine-protein kinase